MFKKFNFLQKVNFLLVIISILFGATELTYSQTSWSQEATQGGFWIKKVVSDTAIATGQPFSYTI
jgi:hypothetical protein